MEGGGGEQGRRAGRPERENGGVLRGEDSRGQQNPEAWWSTKGKSAGSRSHSWRAPLGRRRKERIGWRWRKAAATERRPPGWVFLRGHRQPADASLSRGEPLNPTGESMARLGTGGLNNPALRPGATARATRAVAGPGRRDPRRRTGGGGGSGRRTAPAGGGTRGGGARPRSCRRRARAAAGRD